MYPRNTIFVVGAGASFDLGLPTGDDLRIKLLHVLERDGENARFRNGQLDAAVRRLSQNVNGWLDGFNQYAAAAERIRRGLPLAISIDNYLHAHRNDEIVRTMGKIAIATAILQSEAESELKAMRRSIAGIDLIFNPTGFSESWYLPMMRLLTSGRSVDELEALFTNVGFVIFNYDRCLEHFLVNAVMSYFNATPERAISCVANLKIVHPYGRVGHLPWQGQPVTARFGDDDADLIGIAKDIQTFTESAATGVAEDTRAMIAQAETLIFMGYGFLDQNNSLLTVSKSKVRRVFATTKGFSDTDIPIVKRAISGIVAKNEASSAYEAGKGTHMEVFIERGTCRDLMDNHRLRLAEKPVQLYTLGG